MSIAPNAGRLPDPHTLTHLPRLVARYYSDRPDPSDPAQQVAFGTSGHRGSSLKGSFNEWHILATTQAICDYRRQEGIDGPLFMGMDTHALSEPAFVSALEVLAANGIETRIDAGCPETGGEPGYTPTPAISNAILSYNRGRTSGLADGIVITPSHNPPGDGGFKYNPTNGGPADTGVTKWIQERANALLVAGLDGVKRMDYRQALKAATTQRFDFIDAYVGGLERVIDLDAIRGSGLKFAVDPLGGAGVHYWPRIAERFGIEIALGAQIGEGLLQQQVDHPHFGGGEFAALDAGGVAPVAAEEVVHHRVDQLGLEHDQAHAAQRLEADQVEVGRHVELVQVIAELHQVDAAHRQVGRAADQVEQADAPQAHEALVDHLQCRHPAADDPVLAGEVVGARDARIWRRLGVHDTGIHAVQQGIDLVL